MDLKTKLLSRIDYRDDGCWMWLGAWSSSGYGAICDGKKTRGTHVVSYEVHIGPIPPGIFVLHECDNKWCVNPKHLFLGTCQTNKDDEVAKGKHVFGSKQGQSKLTENDVLHIRNMMIKGQSPASIARLYNVSSTAIYYIRTGQNWSWL